MIRAVEDIKKNKNKAHRKVLFVSGEKISLCRAGYRPWLSGKGVHRGMHTEGW